MGRKAIRPDGRPLTPAECARRYRDRQRQQRNGYRAEVARLSHELDQRDRGTSPPIARLNRELMNSGYHVARDADRVMVVNFAGDMFTLCQFSEIKNYTGNRITQIAYDKGI